MATILENTQRRLIKLTTDDILSIVREYQRVTKHKKSYDEIRKTLKEHTMFLPEDL